MPIIRPSGLAESIRGTLGAVVFIPSFSSGRVRRASRTVREPSALQLEHRARVAAASAAWNAMSDADRDAWNEWADLYGQDVDPEAVATVSGRGRWLGQYLLRTQAGLSPVALPAWPGIGNARPSFLRFTCPDGSIAASAESSVPYPPPAEGPATALIFTGPILPLSSMSFRKRWRFATAVDVTDGGPGVDGPAASVPLQGPLPKGFGTWFRTRVVTGAGNTSNEALWPFVQPPIGQDRAFRTGPVWFLFTPQQLDVTDTHAVFTFWRGQDDEFVVSYPLTTGPTATIGGLADAIVADGLWDVWDRNPSSESRPSTDLIPIRQARPIVETQPVLLTTPE